MYHVINILYIILYCTIVFLSHSSGNYTAKVDEYSNNVTKTMSNSLNSDNSHIITLTESEESVATWITGNIEHLQQSDKVRVTHSSVIVIIGLCICNSIRAYLVCSI